MTWIHLAPPAGETFRETRHHDIPFKLGPADPIPLNLAVAGPLALEPTRLDRLYLLGMVTARAEGSEWWGQAERYHDQTNRLFIGDRLGQMRVEYADETHDVVPFIFGVNVWNYDLYEHTQPGEPGVNTYGGPYREPFESDPGAAARLKDALLLTAAGATKPERWIFAFTPRAKPVLSVTLLMHDYRKAGVYVSAVTGRVAEAADVPDPGGVGRSHDADFWLGQRYYGAMDRLARRLYTFRDELPERLAVEPPAGYGGPGVRFGEGPGALTTAVYLHNLHDMATCKVEPDGTMRTSSPWAPNFGNYVGFGTFKPDAGNYMDHMWSRDVGRSMIELLESGETDRTARAGEVAFKYLYKVPERYPHPHWLRILNALELNDPNIDGVIRGKENDGHGAMMLFVARLFQKGAVDAEWVRRHWQGYQDAAGWIEWQVANPEASGFDGVLWSETEMSTQLKGLCDLNSNTYCVYGLRAVARVAEAIGEAECAARWNELADRLWSGVMERFTNEHPRYGRIWVDTNFDAPSYEFKRFAPLWLMADTRAYDVARADAELFELALATWRAQREDHFDYASGRQMGYGQAWITQPAILLDQFEDMRGFVEQAAAFCYKAEEFNYIVPEGVIMHPSGRFWFRNCDLGNSVQQAEIVKCCRLLIGLDDLAPAEGLRLVPRLPSGWDVIEVADYPVVLEVDGKPRRLSAEMRYRRIDGGYELQLKLSEPARVAWARFGPFDVGAGALRLCGSDYALSESEVAGRRFAYVEIGEALPTRGLRLCVLRG